ncbi:MAG: tetratricopeptide repeat protein [Pikeienuella sp.]
MFRFSWWKDWKGPTGVATLVAILALGFTIFTYFDESDSEPAPPAPVTQTTTDSGSASVGGDGTAVVAGNNSQVTITQIIGYTVEQHEERLAKREADIRAELATAHGQDKALLEQELVEITRQMGDLDATYQEKLKEIERLTAKIATLSSSDASAEAIADAQAALAAGDTSKADTLFAGIVENAEAQLARLAEQGAEAAYQRGLIAEADIRWADAASHFAKAVDLAANYDRLKNAAEYASRSGDYLTASSYSKRLITAAKADHGDDSPEHATALNEHAINLRDMGRYEEAEPLYRQALEIGEATIGREHPNYATRLNNLASLLRAMGRYEEAEPLYRQAMEIDEATIGREHPSYATRLNNLAALYYSMKRYDEAVPLLRESAGIRRSVLGDEHPLTKQAIENLLVLLRSQGGDPAEIAEMEALLAE